MDKIVKSRDGDILENAFPHADEAVENALVRSEAYWKKAKTTGKSLWGGAQATHKKTWGWAKGFIQKHPAQAVGYAVLLGIIGKMIFSSNRREGRFEK